MLSYVSWVSISLFLRFQANNGNIMPKSLIAQNASSRIGWKTAKKTGRQAGTTLNAYEAETFVPVRERERDRKHETAVCVEQEITTKSQYSAVH